MGVNLRTLHYKIPEGFHGKTVEAFLRSRQYSKHIISYLKQDFFLPAQDGRQRELTGMLLNGQRAFSIDRLSSGDQLEINLLETEDNPYVVDSKLPLSIVYEDEDLLIVNKPAGMPIHPSRGHYENTLGNALSYYTHHQLRFDSYVYRVINRLDRDTSGLLISAKNMLSAAILGQMAAEHRIRREYLAICEGLPDSERLSRLRAVSAVEDDAFSAAPSQPFHGVLRISAPLYQDKAHPVERCVDFERGAEAVTLFSLLRYDPEKNLSLLRLRLETGRTHQIRVHMKYIGHPLIGDFLYHPDMRYLQRQALHSHSLRFLHPITEKELCFHAELPEDMKRLFPVLPLFRR